jgi:hypothetical protein
MRLGQLSGSRAEGTLQIAESAINEALAQNVGHGRHPMLEMQPDNIVLVRYGVFHAHARLPRSADVDASPVVTLRLASLTVAWGLKVFVHQPFIHIHGRQLTIELAAMPVPPPWNDWWRHVRHLTFETVAGALRIGFTLDIRAENDDE